PLLHRLFESFAADDTAEYRIYADTQALWRQAEGRGGGARAESMLILLRSTTSGPRRTWAWIEVMYSPRMPRISSCMPNRKNMPTTREAVPRGDRSGRTSTIARLPMA